MDWKKQSHSKSWIWQTITQDTWKTHPILSTPRIKTNFVFNSGVSLPVTDSPVFIKLVTSVILVKFYNLNKRGLGKTCTDRLLFPRCHISNILYSEWNVNWWCGQLNAGSRVCIKMVTNHCRYSKKKNNNNKKTRYILYQITSTQQSRVSSNCMSREPTGISAVTRRKRHEWLRNWS